MLKGGGLHALEEFQSMNDFTDEEKHHKHSLQPSFMHFDYEGHDVHLIDTPGLADFIGHAIACFPAVETVAVVIDALKGARVGAVQDNVVTAFRAIDQSIATRRLIDPSNTNNTVSAALTADAKAALAMAARSALNSSWETVFQ